MSGSRRASLAGVLMASLSMLACASQPTTPAAEPGARGLGLRLALSDSAKSVCVFDEGCSGAPKGAIRIQPLEPQLREALSDALRGLGFELVARDAERDVIADVEWRGTDTIALRLQDARGRLLDQASFKRSLDRCQDLPDLTWDSCWAANFASMKEELSQPLRRSAALQAFAARARRGAGEAAVLEVTATQVGKQLVSSRETASPPTPGALTDELNALQVQETVARYREGLQRTCWLPALEARDPSAPSAARVSTTVTVAPSGSVQSVATSGEAPGYPRLAPCIVAHLRQWRFPAARGSSVASIPFVFVSD